MGQLERLMLTLYKVRGDAVAKHNVKFRNRANKYVKSLDEDHMLLPLR